MPKRPRKINEDQNQDHHEASVAAADVLAEIALSAKMFDNEVSYALKGIPTVPGPCDGQPDGTSCGIGCTCRSGQPWYNTNALGGMGIRLKKSASKKK